MLLHCCRIPTLQDKYSVYQERRKIFYPENDYKSEKSYMYSWITEPVDGKQHCPKVPFRPTYVRKSSKASQQDKQHSSFSLHRRITAYLGLLFVLCSQIQSASNDFSSCTVFMPSFFSFFGKLKSDDQHILTPCFGITS